MSIGEQIKWERECAERGSLRYYQNQDRLRKSGNGDTTDVMSFVIKERLEEVARQLEENATSSYAGSGVKYNLLIRQIADGDYLKMAYIGLKCILNAVSRKNNNTILKVFLDIASHLESELKCQIFEHEHPAYYDKVRKSMKEQNVTDYVHRNKVLMKKFNDFEIKWTEWPALTKIHIGARVMRGILPVFSDVLFTFLEHKNGKTFRKIDTTTQFDDWSAEFEKERGLLYPSFLPLKAPPLAWTSMTEGGYHTPLMSMKFIKYKGHAHRDYVKANIPHKHLAAVNKMQRTAWQINEEVLEVQSNVYHQGLKIGIPSNVVIKPNEFPEHLKSIDKEDLTPSQVDEVTAWKAAAKACYGKERQRKGKVLAFMQGHKLACELRDWDKLYFVYTCDFRGRIYCATSGLSPQGADPAKGLLRFAKAVRLGDTGVKWLAIHGANTYGVDKVSFDDRVQWVADNKANIMRVVEDPINAREFWGEADKPYQFLAFCLEWGKCNYGINKNAMSQLPIGLDGSCNGLQHFSAMLRDEVGAQATNLTVAEKPNDIYKQVADLTLAKLQALADEEDCPLARKWLSVGVTRKCAKRPVMTLPYGATQQSARIYIMDYVMDNWAKFELDECHQWEYAKYLTPILWDAIGEIVIAARGAMTWLQKNTKNEFMSWLTPIGFPVYQFYKNVEVKRVTTMLDGAIQLKVRDFLDVGTPIKSRQRSGIAPNFLHSIDSTHMVMTINGTNFTSYAMIHDDFGTHAGNTEELYLSIRKAFKKLYANCNPLVEYAKQMDIPLDTLPRAGEYEINDIDDATYFFG